MANINEILARAAALREETALNSISPERAGGIMYDTLLALNELWLQQGAALVISKIYASVDAMEADTNPVSDISGKPLRTGQIVVIASEDEDNGSVYRYNGPDSPSWSLVGKIGNLEPVDSLNSDSTQLPLAAHQGKVLDDKISQLGQKVISGDYAPYAKVLDRYINPQGQILPSAFAFYTEPIFVQAGETITYSISGAACAILSSYAGGVITPIIVAGNTKEVFTDATYTATEDMYIMFCGSKTDAFELSSDKKVFEKTFYAISENKNGISQINEELFGVKFGTIQDKYIDPNGEVKDSAFAFYTEPIFVQAGETITYSISGAACAILSKYENGTYTPIVVAGDTEQIYTDATYTAAEDMYIVFCGAKNSLKVASSVSQIEKLRSDIVKNSDEVSLIEKSSNAVLFSEILGKYIKTDGTIGTSSVGFYTNPIQVKAGEIITYSISGWGCAILSKYENGTYTPIKTTITNVSETFVNEVYTATEDELIVFSGTPNTLVAVSSLPRVIDEIPVIKEELKGIGLNSDFSSLRYGVVNADGSINYDVRDSLILGIKGGVGFYLKLNEGFVVNSSHLFDDATGRLLETNYCGNGSNWIPIQYDGQSSYGQQTLINGQHLYVIIKKTNGGDIVDSELETIIKTFCFLDVPRLHRWVLNESYFLFAHKRMRSISNIQWDAKEYVKPVTSAFNAYRFMKGQRYNGVPYSDVSEKMKFIGVEVTPYTFKTASINKRSLIYTEDVHSDAHISKYGIVYNSAGIGAGRCYYGSVCSGFTAAIMGLPVVYPVASYGGGSYPVPNLTTIENADRNNVQPLDLIYYQGHISIISDIYKDDYGKVKYILWAEYNYPNVWINVYTPEIFEARLADKSAIVRRYTDWANTCTDVEIPNCVPAEFNDYARNEQFEKDIFVFSGDKSCFSMDDPIFLNLNRTPGYNTLLIYKDDASSPFLTIDISNMERDTIYPEDTEDWVAYNMRQHELGYGKYSARLYDGATNYSGYVYFEILDTNATLNVNGSTIESVEFTAQNCVAYAAKICGQNYYQTAVKIFTEAEKESGNVSINWQKGSNKYFIIMFKGEYGCTYKQFTL